VQAALGLSGGGSLSLERGQVSDAAELTILLARACIAGTPSIARVVETAAEYYAFWVKVS
jgi:hypothetical protein